MPTPAARELAGQTGRCTTCCHRAAEPGKRTCGHCLGDRHNGKARVGGFMVCCQSHGKHRVGCDGVLLPVSNPSATRRSAQFGV